MAIINCLECGKPISDKANVCSHCGAILGEASLEERERAARIARLKKQNKISMILYTSMIVFLAGVLLVYFGREQATNRQEILGYLTLALGGGAYLFARVYHFMSKR